ncbi:MAG TPA: zinc ribbon domain-containing protein [Coleofasciculaceae cyanobacterium]|jgi:NADH pyrophosphatase NudC (nudix superfamily)
MAYAAILSNTQKLAIALWGTQTQITLMMSSAGQQQSQGSSFSTGKWISKPKLFKVGASFVLQIDTETGSYYIQIQHNSISTIAPISTTDYPMVDLKEVPESGQKPFDIKPMQPMQPMKMDNMSMDINSMSMQMGNMAMSLANQSKTNVTKQFCSQCGTQAKESDRFCRSCGHQLNK